MKKKLKTFQFEGWLLSAATLARVLLGSLAAIALIVFGAYRWHGANNNADVEDASVAPKAEMGEGAEVAGVDSGFYDEV